MAVCVQKVSQFSIHNISSWCANQTPTVLS